MVSLLLAHQRKYQVMLIVVKVMDLVLAMILSTVIQLKVLMSMAMLEAYPMMLVLQHYLRYKRSCK